MLDSPFNVGQILVRESDYKIATIDRIDFNNGAWRFLVNIGAERIWMAESTIRHHGFVPIESTYRR